MKDPKEVIERFQNLAAEKQATQEYQDLLSKIENDIDSQIDVAERFPIIIEIGDEIHYTDGEMAIQKVIEKYQSNGWEVYSMSEDMWSFLPSEKS